MDKLTAYTTVAAQATAEFETAQRMVLAALTEGPVAPALLEALAKSQAKLEVADTVRHMLKRDAVDVLADLDAWVVRELLYRSTGRYAVSEGDRTEALRAFARISLEG